MHFIIENLARAVIYLINIVIEPNQLTETFEMCEKSKKINKKLRGMSSNSMMATYIGY